MGLLRLLLAIIGYPNALWRTIWIWICGRSDSRRNLLYDLWLLHRADIK